MPTPCDCDYCYVEPPLPFQIRRERDDDGALLPTWRLRLIADGSHFPGLASQEAALHVLYRVTEGAHGLREVAA